MPDDYSICPESGTHEPVIALVQDPELIEIGYVTLECATCHQTTGQLLEIDPLKVDW